ncbi:MAG: radical SAM protein [Bacteroidales bacterium]|nr:radical SAM protein [Bacteroidales bacterium]
MDILKKIDLLDFKALSVPLEDLRSCRICPRNCNADRYSSRLGYCKADATFSISSICIHHGEEPAISGGQGICNIFFTHCNLQCIYCQNHQISCNSLDYSAQKIEFKEVIRQIAKILSTGINHVGFVSPSHFVPQVKVIINSLRALGLNPVFVYNTNAYDYPAIIRELESYIDIYLPDFKYSDAALGKKYSDVKDYPEIALSAIKEMFRQKGTELPLDQGGYAMKGIIIRHLVLPGHPENSINVLRTITKELSNDLHISLMSQYYPTYRVNNHEFLGRTLKPGEYSRVAKELEESGFENGWVQELSSHNSYRPDFSEGEPFR